ncbi:mitochondrial protein C2orf69 homolog isoform X2 [Petromyzon marinus]|uniref:UPF0565 protein C2orf69 homolog isoform X1 n=3 Tax=Petromyzon marinus TaxID=7757 RepID=A0AAJ7TVA8_PETMA|nr:UPF0565 protein C2orf69 homolog isoform X1 [Petromyzon marinus]
MAAWVHGFLWLTSHCCCRQTMWCGSGEARVALLRLVGVAGVGACTNDVLVACPVTAESPLRHVVYFPGDIQGYRDEMAASPDSARWQRWSLEETACLLARRFPGRCVWLVRASRMHLHKFSCYDNFVPSNMFGAPEHASGRTAFSHLHRLLSNARAELLGATRDGSEAGDWHSTASGPSGAPPTTDGSRDETSGPVVGEDARSAPELSNVDSVALLRSEEFFSRPRTVTLVGFSKGCVVLNQLLYELAAAQGDATLAPVVGAVRDMYWLDGGHSGGRDTWVTCSDALRQLHTAGVDVRVHVTPYQVCDPMRAWIGKEQRKFISVLQEFGATVTEQIHFEKEASSLENHFRILENF